MENIKVDSKPDPQEIQQKVLLYQILQKHIEELQQQATMLEHQAIEVEMSKMSIKDVGESAKGSQMLFPLGSGIYSKGKIDDNSCFLVELGAGYIARKNSEDTLNFLETRFKDMQVAGEKLSAEMKTTIEKLQTLTAEINEMQSK